MFPGMFICLFSRLAVGLPVLHPMRLCPLLEFVKVSTFVMCVKVSSPSQRLAGVHGHEQRRHVPLAHQRQAECLDTMVYVHAIGLGILLQVGRNAVFGIFPHKQPCVLANKVLHSWSVLPIVIEGAWCGFSNL
jgi:hypothetical protein